SFRATPGRGNQARRQALNARPRLPTSGSQQLRMWEIGVQSRATRQLKPVRQEIGGRHRRLTPADKNARTLAKNVQRSAKVLSKATSRSPRSLAFPPRRRARQSRASLSLEPRASAETQVGIFPSYRFRRCPVINSVAGARSSSNLPVQTVDR